MLIRVNGLIAIVRNFLSHGGCMLNSVLPFGILFETHRLGSFEQSVRFQWNMDPSRWMLSGQGGTAVADARAMNEGEFYDTDDKIGMASV
jgi:hypothetical protein